MVFLSTWILSVLPKKWWKVQSEIEVSGSTRLDVDANDNERLVDLTTKVVMKMTYAIAQGSFGDVWKCRFSEKDNNLEVAVKCVRIEIQDDRFKDIVNKRLMDDFHKWQPLRHDNILPLCGITYGFGPVPAIVSPWMPNASLSTYLDKNYDSLYEAHHKFGLAIHSNEVAHADLTGQRKLALVADYGLLTTCSDLNGTSYIRSNVRWAALELFEVLDTKNAPSSPKLESDIYFFGCIAYQVLPGQQPYCNIRSDHQVVVAILRGVKPKRPDIPAIEEYPWNFIEQCWVELSQRPPIADVRDLTSLAIDLEFRAH
ncbi:kinase-like protein [Suillus weaverae]|nr:kinase-like protein [Suillus weaverae]